MQFDAFTTIVIAVVALLVGYLGGRLASPRPVVTTYLRPLTRDERDRVIALLAEGNTIGAIKVHRELTGGDLKSAHDAVQALKQQLDGTGLGSGGRLS